MTAADKWPAATAEFWPREKIKPYAKNARTHSFDDIKAARAAIDEYGWTYPLLIAEDGELLAGHRRFAASQLEPPMDQVPVLIARGWTEKQKKAYRLWDNKSTLSGGWDDGLLAAELGELNEGGFAMELAGFTPLEMGTLGVPGYELAAQARKAEAAPSPPAKPVVKAGELWLLGNHRLFIGDSTNPEHVAKLLGGGKPPLMVTDPPYGVNYDPSWRMGIRGQIKDVRAHGKVQNDDRPDWTPAWKLFPGDTAYVWCASMFNDVVIASLEAADFIRRAQIIWNKPHFTIGRGDYHWKHEPAWYVVRKGKPGKWTGDRKQTTVWDIAGMNPMGRGGERKAENAETDHGTQKPIECMRRPMLNNSKPGDGVYDPFCGSGTTVIAAEMEKRKCFAMELDPIYAQVIIERWQTYASGTAKREDGATLALLKKGEK